MIFIKTTFVSKNISVSPCASENDLKLINNFTRRNLSKEEIYCFSIILCDNEIDRDFERFTINALNDLSSMFIGKTGVFDHLAKGANQTARIFFTQVLTDENKFTSVGEPYTYILAKAYMVKSAKNADLILEIEAGIKKEVSVGCSVNKISCSICQTNLRNSSCSHVIGQFYDDVMCHSVLEEPNDAYEWSFVAVPSQVNAGVTKSKSIHKNNHRDVLNLIKTFKGAEISLNSHQVRQLQSHIDELTALSKVGLEYFQNLKSETIKLAFLNSDEISTNIFKSVVDKLSISELKQFNKMFSKNINKQEYSPQLPLTVDKSNDSDSFENFSI